MQNATLGAQNSPGTAGASLAPKAPEGGLWWEGAPLQGQLGDRMMCQALEGAGEPYPCSLGAAAIRRFQPSSHRCFIHGGQWPDPALSFARTWHILKQKWCQYSLKYVNFLWSFPLRVRKSWNTFWRAKARQQEPEGRGRRQQEEEGPPHPKTGPTSLRQAGFLPFFPR